MANRRNTTVQPSRILAARLSRGKTRVEVAKAIRCSAALYSNLELGNREADKRIEAIAGELRYPVDFFSQEKIVFPESLSFRRRASMKTIEQARIQGVAGVFAADFGKMIRRYVDAPSPSLPDLSYLASLDEPLKAGEAAAVAIRARFGMGDAPLRHAIDLLEAMGILIFWVSGLIGTAKTGTGCGSRRCMN
jgi:transcriptional regulator with XRE-family HTH domain